MVVEQADDTQSRYIIDKIPRDIESASQTSDSKRSRSYKNRRSRLLFWRRDRDRRLSLQNINEVIPEEDEPSVVSRFSAYSAVIKHVAKEAVLNRNRSFPILILVLGLCATGAFLYVGISSANRNVQEQFSSLSRALVQEIGHSWTDYENAGLWLHCGNGCDRQGFEQVSQQFQYISLQLQAMEFLPNVTHAERATVEEEARAFYESQYPAGVVNYTGFTGYEKDDSSNSTTTVIQNRSEQPFYFPAQFVEQVAGNQDLIGFDLYSDETRRGTLELALSSWKPALTSRILLQDGNYSVQLLHPGLPKEGRPPQNVSSMKIRIHDLLSRSRTVISEPLTVYIYDTTNSSQADFLGGATMQHVCGDANVSISFEPAMSLQNARKSSRRIYEEVEQIASSQWTICIVATVDGTFEPVVLFVILGGTMILVGCVCVALWVFTTTRRQTKFDAMRQETEAEKAALVVSEARKAARNERELNDFIAHEVRNPLAAAMSACSFVASAVNDESTITKPEKDDVSWREPINEDLKIIDSALHFINDLLRNMLDMQRAKSQQLNIDWAPVDVLQDVLKPVDAMLYRRGGNLQVQVECPPNLFVMSDRLRLKQIALNLGRNSLKFVEKGFIRLKAAIMLDGTVAIFIEDSGPGIPMEKRKKLFAKFQESLDSLNQGTGIGLCLCLNLVELMGGSITLDENYDSGVPGCPGTRFVICLNKEPLKLDDTNLELLQNSSTRPSIAGNMTNGDELQLLGDDQSDLTDDEEDPNAFELPEKLSVLFVDDDVVLRKLFSRGIKRVCPNWSIQEASNGESAIRQVEESEAGFGLIFVDQYMASVEKQLLGTETVRALRASGCQACICGLSANDVQAAFESAGSDAFMFKPFPTKPDSMKRELIRILKAATTSAAVKLPPSFINTSPSLNGG